MKGFHPLSEVESDETFYALPRKYFLTFLSVNYAF